MARYRIEVLAIETSPGKELEQQKRDACIAALENNCTVTFIHNARLFRVEPTTLADCVWQSETK